LRAGHGEVRLEPLLKERDAMLGQVPSDKEEKTMKKDKRRDLPPIGLEIAMNDLYQSPLLESLENSLSGTSATPWLLTNIGYFRVTLTIVGPIFKIPHHELRLSHREAKHAVEEIADLVKAFLEKSFREDSVI